MARTSGGLAQLGERLHGMQEVTGSIPVFSTRRKRHRTGMCGAFCFIQTHNAQMPSPYYTADQYRCTLPARQIYFPVLSAPADYPRESALFHYVLLLHYIIKCRFLSRKQKAQKTKNGTAASHSHTVFQNHKISGQFHEFLHTDADFVVVIRSRQDDT